MRVVSLNSYFMRGSLRTVFEYMSEEKKDGRDGIEASILFGFV